MPDIDNIEIRSEEVQEVIGTPPAKIVRIGITSIFALVLILFVGSFFFKYPDIISARITILGENPSAVIKARANGKITNLFISDKQNVEKNETLAIIENTCNYKDLQILKTDLDSIENAFNHSTSGIGNIILNLETKTYRLGEIQSHYSEFFRKINEYKDFLELDYNGKKIKSYTKQIKAYKRYLYNLRRQLSLSKNDLDLSLRQYKRDSVLFKKNFMSDTEFEKSKSTILNKKRSVANSWNSISDTEIRISELEQFLLETELQKTDQKRKFEISIIDIFENLNVQIKLWEQTFLLKSPIKGKITFTNFFNENQNVNIGESIFTVIPKNTSELVGYAEIPLSGSGKVKKGHRVNIKFDDFPDTQFGMVKGTVETISLVQSNEFYMVKVSLPDSLRTNYKKTLPFKQNMKGNAEILTDELPLIARLVNPIKSLFYEKF